MTETTFSKENITVVDYAFVQTLKKKAELGLYRRSRFCLHLDPNKTFHEMINVFCFDTYIRPHRHPDGKCESYQILEGRLLICIFDNLGNVIDKIILTPYQKAASLFLRLNTNYWHMQIPLTEFVVFVESYQGPFLRESDVEEASWAPLSNEPEKVQKYILMMKSDLRT